MEYPILDKNSKPSDPSPGKCLVCGANLRETGFVWFMGQCDLHTRRGFLENIKPRLHWSLNIDMGFHGCHGAEHEGRLRKDRFVYVPIWLAKDFRDNGIELQFCSTQCARKWFNELMDDLDQSVEKAIQEENAQDE